MGRRLRGKTEGYIEYRSEKVDDVEAFGPAFIFHHQNHPLHCHFLFFQSFGIQGASRSPNMQTFFEPRFSVTAAQFSLGPFFIHMEWVSL